MPFWILGVFIFLAGLLTTQWNFLIALLVMAGGVVTILLYITVAPKFPVSAWIFLKRHGNLRIVTDKASRIRTDRRQDTFYYKFKKLKDTTKAAVYDNLYPFGKGEVALFYSPAPGEYYQAVFEESVEKRQRKIKYRDNAGNWQTKDVEVEEAIIKPIPDDLLEHMVLKQARQKAKYMQVSAWEKYYPIIVVAVLGVIIVIVVSSLFNSMTPFTESLEEASANNLKASTSMAAALNRIADKEEGTQPVGTSGQPLPKPPDVG